MKNIAEIFMSIVRETIELHGLSVDAHLIHGKPTLSNGGYGKFPLEMAVFVLDEDYGEANTEAYETRGGAYMRGVKLSARPSDELLDELCAKLDVTRNHCFEVVLEDGFLFLRGEGIIEKVSKYAEVKQAIADIL